MELLRSSRRKRDPAERPQPSCSLGSPGPQLPTGTISFPFTDIEGSTRRWEDHPVEIREALARHNRILVGAVESSGGILYETMGDGLVAVFSSHAAPFRPQCRRKPSWPTSHGRLRSARSGCEWVSIQTRPAFAMAVTSTNH